MIYNETDVFEELKATDAINTCHNIKEKQSTQKDIIEVVS